jgi:hypothetical protein
VKDLTLQIEITRRMESQLVKAILSSWLFSVLAIIIQYRQFDIAFGTLVTIVGGVVGTAAILSVYLRRVQHPAFLVDYVLRNRPFGGFLAIILMLGAAICFYYYYQFAKQSNETCLLFFGAGTFLFFYTLSDAASRMLVNEQQKIVWQSMTPEQQWDWRKENDPKIIQLEWLERQLEELQSKALVPMEELERKGRELAEKRWQKEQRREHFTKRVRSTTYPIRTKFGLVSGKEKKDRELEASKREIEKIREQDKFEIWWNWGDNLHKQNATKIHNSEVSPITLEGSGLQIFEFGEYYKYFVVKEKIDQNKANWYLEALKALGEQNSILGKFQFLAGILLPNVEVTYEARKNLENVGIELYKYIPMQESSEQSSLPSEYSE